MLASIAILSRVSEGQAAAVNDSRTATAGTVSAAPARSPVFHAPVGVPRRPVCAAPMTCAMADQPEPYQDDVERRRARFALVGFLVGAGVGGVVYLQACANEDCMNPFGGILLSAAGGLLGMVVGLLLGPSPGR